MSGLILLTLRAECLPPSGGKPQLLYLGYYERLKYGSRFFAQIAQGDIK